MSKPFSILFIATTVLCAVQSQSVGTDCNGKAFLCLDNQRFQTCSQNSDGQYQTADSTINECPANEICSNADSSACSSPNSEVTTTEAASTTTVKPFTCEKSGRFPHESECHEFYRCVWFPFGMSKIESTCLFGMVFDPNDQRCTYDQSKCRLQNLPFTCTSAGRFPNPSEPTGYFVCHWDGMRYQLFKKTCWLGYTFNANQAKCNGFLGF